MVCIVCKTTRNCLSFLHLALGGHHEAPRGNDEVETARNNEKQRETAHAQILEIFATRYLCMFGDSVVCEIMKHNTIFHSGPFSQIHLFSHSFTTLFPSVMTNLSLSTLSLNSTSSDSQNEDWDQSLEITDEDMTSENTHSPLARTTPRNSVVFPADETPGRLVKTGCGHGRDGSVDGKGKRTLSELLKMHSERGTNCQFSVEEASRVGDVLGQWVGATLF